MARRHYHFAFVITFLRSQPLRHAWLILIISSAFAASQPSPATPSDYCRHNIVSLRPTVAVKILFVTSGDGFRASSFFASRHRHRYAWLSSGFLLLRFSQLPAWLTGVRFFGFGRLVVISRGWPPLQLLVSRRRQSADISLFGFLRRVSLRHRQIFDFRH